MKAAFIREHGGPEVLEVGELEDPVAGAGQVVVDVEACALNHLDLWVRRGLPGLDLELPHVGASDVAGTVAALGPGVEGWSRGDRVVVNPAQWCGRCEWCVRGEHSLCEEFRILGEHIDGGAAEKVRVPAESLYALPDDVPFEDAAAVPLVFQTAWRALIGRADVRPGETVLVTGGSGGVSTAAIQIARLAGARVLAVTSGPENVERVRALGADVAIDRLEEDFSKAAYEATGRRGVDVVLDSVGEAIWDQCVRALARNGRLVTYGATTGASGRQDIRRMFWKQVRIIGTTMASRSEFERVMDLVFAGRLEPVIDVVWPLERIAEAHERLEGGDQFGKVVLVP
ncbi:MAG TPA: zinc-binding dehydrogenase [Gemmatimonadota bacterium]|nr:zinc-binding dehydrogenase [Gemmatimonadota bacterium]